MAAELSDMAEPPQLLSSSGGGGGAEEAAESEAPSSSSSSSSSAAGMEAESPPLPGEGAESMSEPSPESASQAGDGDDEEEEDDEDEEEEEEEDEAASSAGSSSGCCSDESRSLSPGGSEADSKGEAGGGGGAGPGSSGGGGGTGGAAAAAGGVESGSGGKSGSGSSVSSSSGGGGDEGYGTGGGGGAGTGAGGRGGGRGGGGGGGSSTCSASSGGRRGSLEISSDGEPLSRMDSEDSISSTIMDADSTISSGRSTPVMMNGQGVTASSAKSIAYNCCWDQCHACFNSSPDLADHIRSIHVDGQQGGVFVCLWKGCKVYNTPSTSQSWLQRHMLTHSGDKPFKCVVGGCNASFASQSGLARHVPTHFSQQNSSKVTNQPKAKEESPSKAGMNKRRKLKNKRRRSLPRPHDFFDAQTLDAIRHRAICFNLSAHIESLGKGHSVVFHSTVIAKRKEESGKIKLLLHWTPEDILPDVWVNESERHQLKTKVVHLSKLPKDTALLLDPNIYSGETSFETPAHTTFEGHLNRLMRHRHNFPEKNLCIVSARSSLFSSGENDATEEVEEVKVRSAGDASSTVLFSDHGIRTEVAHWSGPLQPSAPSRPTVSDNQSVNEVDSSVEYTNFSPDQCISSRDKPVGNGASTHLAMQQAL